MTDKQKQHVHFATTYYTMTNGTEGDLFSFLSSLIDFDRDDPIYTRWACDVSDKIRITAKHFGEDSDYFKQVVDDLLWI